MSGTGQIMRYIEYSVWCALCDNLEDYTEYANAAQAARQYRKDGWRKTKKHGWVCPECAKQLKRQSQRDSVAPAADLEREAKRTD